MLKHLIPSVLSFLVLYLIILQFTRKKKNNGSHLIRGISLLLLVIVVILSNLGSFAISWDIPWMIHFIPGVGFLVGMLILLVTGLRAWFYKTKIWKGHRAVAIITTAMFVLSIAGAMAMPFLRRAF